jgi:hypothetical protein
MNRREANYKIMNGLAGCGIEMSYEDIDILRRAEITLHRWHEMECGDGRGCIERDEKTDKPYYLSSMSGNRYSMQDREKGALKRIDKVCKANSLQYYIQGDCRGAALYVDKKPIAGNDYNRAFCLCGR